MPKRDSFAVRASRRRYENYNKACPICGQADPLLLTDDGTCANCASGYQAEEHHILPKAYRTTPEDEQAVIPISPNAHRLVSDMQVDHPAPPELDSASYLPSLLLELLVSFIQLALALEYVNEQPNIARSASTCALILFVFWCVLNVSRIDLAKMLTYDKEA